jgi:glycosyltransferase involved in cell wall biosynthesis
VQRDHEGCDYLVVAPRVAVIIPCYRDGEWVAQAVASVSEDEPVEMVVVDDASPDDATRSALAELERAGTRILRRDVRAGPAACRQAGISATSAPFVYPLDADDLALPGVLAQMASALERDADACACVGDIAEFGDHSMVRRTPAWLDPYRVAFTNEYPVTALFRRSVLEAAGGYARLPGLIGYEDWNLWMTLAERGERIVHLRSPGYRRRIHGTRLGDVAREDHRRYYSAMRRAHPDLFTRIPAHRTASDLPPVRKLLYPLLFGMRARVPFERRLKPLFDRLGFWTRARRH